MILSSETKTIKIIAKLAQTAQHFQIKAGLRPTSATLRLSKRKLNHAYRSMIHKSQVLNHILCMNRIPEATFRT